jgi:hypothetical protein
MEDLHDLFSFDDWFLSSMVVKKARKVPEMQVYFLYALSLTSDNWRFKKAPGDIFGLMFASINTPPLCSEAKRGRTLLHFAPMSIFLALSFFLKPGKTLFLCGSLSDDERSSLLAIDLAE